jgi:MFS family permease
MKTMPKTVVVLGIVSLLTDASSEMIYPLLPLFLTQVLLAGPLAIGVIEGIAESTASILKLVSGIWADRLKRRKPLIVLGYGLSGFFRPFIGLATTWPMVLFIRFADRVGKGLRSSPRDALIADVTTPANRGAAYGFHRAMDHAGSVVGPLIAGALMAPVIGLSYRVVFLLAAVPALAAWLTLVWGVREKVSRVVKNPEKLDLFRDWRKLGGGLRTLFLALLLFTLGNSTDAFLLVRLSQVGIEAWLIPILWAALHVVKMGATFYGGRLSDSWGRKPPIVLGWFYFAAIYLAFAMVSEPTVLIVLFLAYGIYFGLCEPSEKALVADWAPSSLRGTAFGYYNLVVGLGALPASLLFGFVGQTWGYPAAFVMGASFAGLASVILFCVKKRN